MKRNLLVTTAALGLIAAGPALSQSLAQRLADAYQERGFDYVEVYEGPSQIKVEATSGNRTLEVIYNAATGAILYNDIDSADADDRNSSGVEFNRTRDDFVSASGYDDDDDYDDGDYDDDDYDDDDDDYDDDDDWGRDDDDSWSDDDDWGDDDWGDDDDGWSDDDGGSDDDDDYDDD